MVAIIIIIIAFVTRCQINKTFYYVECHITVTTLLFFISFSLLIIRIEKNEDKNNSILLTVIKRQHCGVSLFAYQNGII